MSTILLVDDDPDILKLISLRLTAAGHSVKGADSGEKALAVLAASRPELVITDLKMGGMDGDRKSTRLNSSHGYISYAVFCLKKKKKNTTTADHIISTGKTLQ